MSPGSPNLSSPKIHSFYRLGYDCVLCIINSNKENKTKRDMWFKMGFRFLADKKKFEMLRERGIMLGSRWRNERRVYLYMVKDFFVEVMYMKDDIDLEPEKISTFSSLENLNAYLERDFRTAF